MPALISVVAASSAAVSAAAAVSVAAVFWEVVSCV